MKKSQIGIALIFVCIVLMGNLSAEDTTIPSNDFKLFIGLQPSVTVEPEYAPGVFDFNVVPLCFELTSQQIPFAIRSTIIVNARFGEASPYITHVGGTLTIPWYPFALSMDATGMQKQGLYIGPKAGSTYQPITGIWTMAAALEGGWSFAIDTWSVLVSAEYGYSYFVQNGVTWITGHGGISAVFGFWL